MKYVAAREQRSRVLIANFNGGYTQDWKFRLPDVFKDALDIKRTNIVVSGKSHDVLTQGRLFNFIVGSVIYDNEKAYELKWEEALKHVRLIVQVVESIPSIVVTKETITVTQTPIQIKVQTEKGDKDEIVDDITLERQKVEYGKIKFKLMRPNKKKDSVEELEIIDCDQEEFVAFLQMGTIINDKGHMRDIFELYADNLH